MKNMNGWIIASAILVGFFFRDITGYSIPEFLDRFRGGEVTPAVLRQVAQEQNRRLPISSGDGQTWIRSEANGMTLRHTYQVVRSLSAEEISSARSQAARNLPSRNCADGAVTRLLDDGVRIEYAYIDSNNRALFSIAIDSSSC